MTEHRHRRPMADQRAAIPHGGRVDTGTTEEPRRRPGRRTSRPAGVAAIERELAACRQPPTWPAALLALLLATACAVGGCNNGPLAAAFAAFAGLFTACIFAGGLFTGPRAPTPPRQMQIPRATLVLLVLWFGWLATSAALRASGAAAPLLTPELHTLAWVRKLGTLAIFLAATRIGMAHGALHLFTQWLGRLTAPLILLGALFQLLDLPVDWAWLDSWLGIGTAASQRLTAPIGNPNANGALFAMLALVASGIAIARVQSWYDLPSDHRLMAMLVSVMIALGACITVGLTQSRTALVLLLGGEALLCGATLAGAANPRRAARHRMARRAGAIAIVAIVALAMVAAGATLDRLGLFADARAGRLAVWQAWLGLLAGIPLSGHGPGAFAEFNLRHLTPETALSMWNFGAAHAAPLQEVIEHGWPALALAAAFLLALGRDLVAGLRPSQDPVRTAALLAVLLALLAACVDIALDVPAIAALTAALAGLCWGRRWRAPPHRPRPAQTTPA